MNYLHKTTTKTTTESSPTSIQELENKFCLGRNKKTSFVWEESLFNKISKPKCVAPVYPSQQLKQML
jgi:hypothetical protein